jgi:hypothetical protein
MDKYHIIYRVTNILNGRYYIGMHSTTNIQDEYLGSGKRIKAEVKKYGKENFTKEIIEVLPSRQSLMLREAELVTTELLSDPLCLNLKNGGEGGWDHIDSAAIEKRARSISKSKIGVKQSSEHRKAISESKMGNKNFANSPGFTGIVPTEEHRRKIGEKNKQLTGERNSQFGTCWVTDGVKPIKIQKEELDRYLALSYRRGRK